MGPTSSPKIKIRCGMDKTACSLRCRHTVFIEKCFWKSWKSSRSYDRDEKPHPPPHQPTAACIQN